MTLITALLGIFAFLGAYHHFCFKQYAGCWCLLLFVKRVQLYFDMEKELNERH